MKSIFTLMTVLLISNVSKAQNIQGSYKQYFDGEDTLYNSWAPHSSLLIAVDTVGGNIWQIGAPQKALFDSAATQPNAIVTDTLNYYPTNDTSSFSFYVEPMHGMYGITAVQWKQKLDFEAGKDGGRIEFSTDSGLTWYSVFDNPFTYNFYGFDSANVDTLIDGEYAFTGTDSIWRDVWLCFDNSWIVHFNGLLLRFTSLSDDTESNQEGWMMDNFLVHKTLIHVGINEKGRKNYFEIYPNPAQDRLFIDIKKLNEFHIIEHMAMVDIQGRLIKEWRNVPTHFFIDTKTYAEGNYFLKIKTNKSEETIPFVIQRK